MSRVIRIFRILTRFFFVFFFHKTQTFSTKWVPQSPDDVVPCQCDIMISQKHLHVILIEKSKTRTQNTYDFASGNRLLFVCIKSLNSKINLFFVKLSLSISDLKVGFWTNGTSLFTRYIFSFFLFSFFYICCCWENHRILKSRRAKENVQLNNWFMTFT